MLCVAWASTDQLAHSALLSQKTWLLLQLWLLTANHSGLCIWGSVGFKRRAPHSAAWHPTRVLLPEWQAAAVCIQMASGLGELDLNLAFGKQHLIVRLQACWLFSMVHGNILNCRFNTKIPAIQIEQSVTVRNRLPLFSQRALAGERNTGARQRGSCASQPGASLLLVLMPCRVYGHPKDVAAHILMCFGL